MEPTFRTLAPRPDRVAARGLPRPGDEGLLRRRDVRTQWRLRWQAGALPVVGGWPGPAHSGVPAARPAAGAGGVAGLAGAGVGKVASLQNQVETKKKAEGGWSPSSLNQTLYGEDRVRTGPASRASILYSDRTTQRLG